MLNLIMKTRDGHPLTKDEIHGLIQGVVDGTWPDYQLAAWLMAVYFRGLTEEETFALTGAMAFSGSPSVEPLGLVDKHSTGGVGDKTTLVLAPVMAALGLPMAKMSGRGLGHTGGTLDKLQSIPGFRVDLSPDEVRRQVQTVGVAVLAQSAELAPSDRKLYALRDVTGTVDSIALIASSVMSKKLAGGTRYLVLDVKVGSGAFMPTVEKARELARLMVRIGQHHGRTVTALLTNMQQPLGFAVGNAIEINEAARCLKGQGPEDLHEEVVVLASELLHMAKNVPLDDARRQVDHMLATGAAWETFGRWITAQGGRFQDVEQGLPLAPVYREWRAHSAATVAAINTRAVGEAALDLGAGRHRLEDPVDPGVGVQCYAKIGRRFEPGELVAAVYARTSELAEHAMVKLQNAIRWGIPDHGTKTLVFDRISGEASLP